MDRFVALRSFLAVAEAQSFVQAATALGVSKAAVSKHVSALETHLGVALFHRSSRAVRLTEAGARFLTRAQDVLGRLDAAEAEAADLHSDPIGHVRINAPVAFGARYVAPVLADYLDRHPDLTASLDLEDRRVDLIDEGYDLVVRVLANHPDSSLRARKLAEAAYLLVAAPDYVTRRGEPSSPEALRDHSCLDYALGAERRVWRFVGPDGAARAVRIDGPLTANNGEALLYAAEQGLGIARIPAFLCADALTSGRVRRIMPSYGAPPLQIHALTPPDRPPPAKVRGLLGALAAAFKPAPPWPIGGLQDLNA